MSKYQLDEGGAAELAHIDGLIGIRAARPHLRALALSGHPTALEAYRCNKRADRWLMRANELISQKPKAA